MYAKNTMGGNIDPYINIIFSPVKGDEPQIVSLIIFAWSDVLDVGVPELDGSVVSPPPRDKRPHCRKYLFVIQRPLSGNYVHRNILGNFWLRIHRDRGVYLPRQSISPNRNRINITSKRPIIIVSQLLEWVSKFNIMR